MTQQKDKREKIADTSGDARIVKVRRLFPEVVEGTINFDQQGSWRDRNEARTMRDRVVANSCAVTCLGVRK